MTAGRLLAHAAAVGAAALNVPQEGVELIAVGGMYSPGAATNIACRSVVPDRGLPAMKKGR